MIFTFIWMEETGSTLYFFYQIWPNSKVPGPEGKFIEAQISAEPGSAYGIQLTCGPPWFLYWSCHARSHWITGQMWMVAAVYSRVCVPVALCIVPNCKAKKQVLPHR